MAVTDHDAFVGHVVLGSPHPVVQTAGLTGGSVTLLASLLGILTPVLTAIATILAIICYGVTLNDRFKLYKRYKAWQAKREASKNTKV